MRMRPPLALLLFLGLLGPLAAASAQVPAGQQPARVQVVDSGLTRKPPAEQGFDGLQYTSQGFTLSNGVVRYGIDYHAYWDAEGKTAKPSPEGYLGMPLPTGCNWYHGGFMSVSFNGLNLGNIAPAVLRVVEQGQRGLIELLWKTAEGQVRIRFLQEPEADYLAAELAVLPTSEIRSLDLSLRCYPSYFTGWNKRDGWRQIIGPMTTTEQGQTKALDPLQDWWLLYQDRVFDYALNRDDSAGPCGLLYLPEQIKSVQVLPTSYPVTTNVTVKPTVRSVRLAFWEFPKKTNAESLQRLRQGAAQVAEHLRQVDFSDSQVAAFDAAGERAALAAMIAKTKEPEAWRQRLAPMLDQVAAAQQAYRSNDLSAEQTASAALAKYRDAVWDLKFEALLSD
ncbi:MAG TPA: hypothetical protein VHS06_11170 [Chloroflexota bacterium]|nr:hypothetical protein [Chloroflexota bacterium]